MAGNGEDQAARFRASVLPLLGYLQRLGVALTGNRESAEDLVQESVLRGLRYYASFRGDDFRAWMAAIMRNVSRDRPKQTTMDLDQEMLEEIPDPSLDPEQRVLADDQAARLRALLNQLPDPLREALVLREFGELSYSQIASALDVPIGTVMSRLSRARDDLRKAWLADNDGCVA